MNHFFCDDVSGARVELTGDEARHAARALRVRAGEIVSVSDGRGSVVWGPVADTPTSVRLVIDVTERVSVPLPRPILRVAPAVPKKGKLDLVVEKLTEIGAGRVSPWFAERSVARWDARKRAAAGERLRSIARAAAKQSHRAWLPEVDDPADEAPTDGTVLVLEQGAPDRLRAVLDPAPPSVVTLVVGPEGGLSDAELERFRGDGAHLAGLGSTVLRTETASIVAAALVLGHYHLVG